MIDFLYKVITHPKVTFALAILGFIAVLVIIGFIFRRYLHIWLFYPAQFFIPSIFVFIYLSYKNDTPKELLWYLVIGGLLVSILFFFILLENYKAYKANKPPPYKGIIYFSGTMALVLIFLDVYLITGFNVLEVIRDGFSYFRTWLGI
ncbi:MAG: hypothetical protein GWN16_11180 [Calditrichae bacterium]|nr:hypothetical protein [Calditrichia bacterium]NIW79977.1 hypothetical protein [Calditrichia bacterium]